jgi:hypothetical protein
MTLDLRFLPLAGGVATDFCEALEALTSGLEGEEPDGGFPPKNERMSTIVLVSRTGPVSHFTIFTVSAFTNTDPNPGG